MRVLATRLISVTNRAGGITQHLIGYAVTTLHISQILGAGANLTYVESSHGDTRKFTTSFAALGVFGIVALKGDPAKCEVYLPPS